MEWINGKVTSITTFLGSVFAVLVIVMAIKEFYQKKMISVVLLLILAGLLGWLVYDTASAIEALKKMWS
jgi:TctA family transporter